MAIDLIEYKTWLSRTSAIGHFRSSQLETLDKALKTYEGAATDANLSKVRQTFEAWKLKEGVNWRQSRRNTTGAFSKLEELLNPRSATPYDEALAHSRLGLMYLFQDMEVEMGMGKIILEGAFDLFGNVTSLPGVNVPSLVNTAATGVQTVTLQMLEMKGGGTGPKVGAPTAQVTLWTKIKQTFMDFAKKIYESIKSKYQAFWNSSSTEKAESIWSCLTGVVNFVSNNVLAQAIPFLGASIDIANGIKDTAVGCYHRYQAYVLGKGVILNEGHPGVIASSIERAMNLGIGKGLYDTFKGAGNIAMQATSFGAAAVVSLVIAGCELLAKVIYRLWEASGMRTFFADCKKRYAAKDKIYESAPDFTEWYSKAAYALPCLSALAVNSGITGDKMSYLSMFSDGTQKVSISQARFDQGVAYIDKLKAWSSDYLESTGYEFDSHDATVKGLLKRVITSKKPVLTQIFTTQNVNPHPVTV